MHAPFILVFTEMLYCCVAAWSYHFLCAAPVAHFFIFLIKRREKMNSILYIDPSVIRLIPYIVIIIVLTCLAFIPSSIAGNKGHSRIGFFFFGLAALIPAIIVACLIKDTNAQIKRDKQYDELLKEVKELKDTLNKQNQPSEQNEKENKNN